MLLVIFQECESLAQQLISGRIERAQEAEDVMLLRRELAIARKKLEEQDRLGSMVSHDGGAKSPCLKERPSVVSISEVVPEWEDPNDSPHRNVMQDEGAEHVSGVI